MGYGVGVTQKEPWASLEIAPTTDIRAIKSAYAVRLKLLDVEADPLAFVALREKLTWALQLAQTSFPKEQSSPSNRQQIDWSASPDSRWDLPIPPSDRERYALEKRQHDLLQLLDERKGSSSEIYNAAVILLRSSALSNVDSHSKVELWLANVMAELGAVSDPIIDLIVYHFRWNEITDAVRTPDAIRQIAQRQNDLMCLSALRDPAHPWHLAFLELSTSTPSPVTAADQRMHGSKVRLLLESLRTHNPAVQDVLNVKRVAEWDDIHRARMLETISEVARIEGRDGPPKRPFPWIAVLALAAQTLFLIVMFG